MLLTYHGKGILVCEGVRFFAGENKVTEDQLKKLIKNSLFRWRVDKGLIQVPNYSSYIKDEEEVAESEMDIKQKLHAIKTSFSIEAIKKIVRKEKNHRLIDAADIRIAELMQNEEREKELKNPLSSVTEIVEPSKDNNFNAKAGLL